MPTGGSIQVNYDDFKAFNYAMRGADRELSNEFLRMLRREVNQGRNNFRASFATRKHPPIAHFPTAVRSKVSSRRARIDAMASSNLRLLNAGMIRHPLFGDSGHWYTTRYPHEEKWWDEVADEEAPRLSREAALMMDEYTNKLAARIDAAKAFG